MVWSPASNVAVTARVPNLHVYRLPWLKVVPVMRMRVPPLVGPAVGVMLVQWDRVLGDGVDPHQIRHVRIVKVGERLVVAEGAHLRRERRVAATAVR